MKIRHHPENHRDEKDELVLPALKHKWIWLCLALTLLPNHPAHASDQAAAVYRGNALEYFASRLPNPMVVYVYSSNARLQGIVDPHGHTDNAALQKVTEAIAHQAFDETTEAERKRTAASLESFIDDQGYDMSTIVDHKTPLTLLLVLQQVKPTDCQTYADVERRFQDAIARTISANAAQRATYSLAIIEVGSPKSTITCK